MPTRRWSCAGHVAQPLAEHLREGRLGRRGRLLHAHRRVELARAVVVDRVGLGQLVAVALLGDDVQELRALHVAQVLQRRDQRVEVVAVDRADVVEAELLEDRARHDHALGMLLEAARQLEQRRRVLQHLLGAVARGGVELAAHQARQVACSARRPAGRSTCRCRSARPACRQHAGMRTPALFSASKAMPAVIAPSPMMATALRSSPLSLRRHRHAERGRDRGGASARCRRCRTRSRRGAGSR